MTTIAYNHKDQELASDGQATSGWVKCSDTFTKIHRLSFGWAAFCGTAADVGSYIKILEGEELVGDRTKLECGVIVVPDKGVPYKHFIDAMGHSSTDPVKGNLAMGSGMEFALGALHAGASAKEAVKAAIAYDVMSGGRVVVKKRGVHK